MQDSKRNGIGLKGFEPRVGSPRGSGRPSNIKGRWDSFFLFHSHNCFLSLLPSLSSLLLCSFSPPSIYFPPPSLLFLLLPSFLIFFFKNPLSQKKRVPSLFFYSLFSHFSQLSSLLYLLHSFCLDPSYSLLLLLLLSFYFFEFHYQISKTEYTNLRSKQTK